MIRAMARKGAAGCDEVIASLPYHFGDPAGVADCARAVRSQRGVVAEVDGAVAGFITLLHHFPASAEITWMGVHARHRRRGIGSRLIEAAVEAARADGATMLCVMTLGPSVPEERSGDNYEGTRRFYRSNGFVPLRELGLREWNDSHALMLARAI
jgi:GNAT superfamily N-acetyltransferase